jgi:uncharacterized membrane protein
MSSSSTRHRIALVIAFLGLVVSGVILYEELQLAHDPGHSSFCTIGGVFNCDVVLSSRYGEFLDVPLGVWAIVAFLVGALAAVPGAFVGDVGGLADLVRIAMASGALGFALVLAGVMATVLHHVCLLCLTLDVVIVAWVVTVLPLAGNFAASASASWLRRRTAAYATAALALTAAFASGALSAVYTPTPAATAAEIEAREPEFTQHYLQPPDHADRERHVARRRREGPRRRTGHDRGVLLTSSARPAARRSRTCTSCSRVARTSGLVFRNFRSTRRATRRFPARCTRTPASQPWPRPRMRRFPLFESSTATWESAPPVNQVPYDAVENRTRTSIHIPTFRTCLDAQETKDRVSDDIRAGIAAGIESTPTLFINGRKIDGALERPYYDYALVLEQERGGTAPRRP